MKIRFVSKSLTQIIAAHLTVNMSSLSLTCEYFPQLWTAAEADLLT